jgi:hypothetical protein
LAGTGACCEHGAVTSAPPRVAPRDLPQPPSPARRAPATPERSSADVAMRRLLRISDRDPRVPDDELRRGFSQSMVISGLRCLLTYIFIPFVTPLLGLAAGVGPIIGISIGVLAIVFNIRTMRRFWAADHKWRWAYSAVGGTVIVMLLVLIAMDVAHLMT